MNKKPLLVMFIGIPGSGKTYFATRLAEKIDAVRLNSDAMRISLFGSLDKIKEMYYSDDRYQLNDYTFRSMKYATTQILKTKKSVVYEAIQRTSSDRKEMEDIALECGAIPILVWMKTDPEVALKRGVARLPTPEHRNFDEKTMREVIKHFSDGLDAPAEHELLIEISGEIPFEEQYDAFVKGLPD